MKKKRGDETRHIEGWQSKNERIESLLNVLYDFRFNTVKSRTEYRAAGSSDLYQPVTKFALNTFRRRLDATADIATSTDNIRMILESDFARKAHPIQEYFNALPLLNPAEHGHIGRLLNTVQVANPGKWEEIFHEMAYRCGSQRDERHGMSEPYLFGTDRGRAGTIQIVVAGQPLPDTA